MAENSNIEWTTHTFTPWRGCSKVSPGCANCYADTLSHRNPATLGVWGPNGTRVVAAESQWRLPLKWDREAAAAGERHRVFCASLADIFEDWQGDMVNAVGERLYADDYELFPLTMGHVRRRLFGLIDQTPNLDWLLLTKRPENFRSMLPLFRSPGVERVVEGWPRHRNVWLGTSVEDQQWADERIPHLLSVPAAVRFLSAEPLLGPIVFDNGWNVRGKPWVENGIPKGVSEGVDWIIVGGESGPNARPCNVEWVRGIVRQCKEAGVACFVKQLGSNVVDECENCTPEYTGWPPENSPIDWDTGAVKLRDRKGGDIDEWPEDLRVREFPACRAGKPEEE